jgi:hypothetical protein
MHTLITLNALIFYAIAVAGTALHVIIRWSNGEIQGTLGSWWTSNKRRSVAAVMLIVGSVITCLASGVFINPNDVAQVIAAFGIGYVGDSSVNKQGPQNDIIG